MRVIKKEGKATLVTDDKDFAKQISDTILENKNWQPLFKKPYYVETIPDFGESYFSLLWKGKGKTIHYFQFVNKKIS